MASADTQEARGVVRLLMPPAVSVHQVAKHLPRFRQLHPNVKLEIDAFGPVEAGQRGPRHLHRLDTHGVEGRVHRTPPGAHRDHRLCLARIPGPARPALAALARRRWGGRARAGGAAGCRPRPARPGVAVLPGPAAAGANHWPTGAPRRWAAATLWGKSCSRLPASISFCRAGCFKRAGRAPTWLSVSVSQRSRVGRAASGTSTRPQPRKPTWLSSAQSPSAGGRVVKGLPEQNRACRRCSLPRSGGNSLSWLPLRSKTSSVSARSNSSVGSGAGHRWRRRSVDPAQAAQRAAAQLF